MVLTTLWSGGASHHSLSHYVASLLAAKSRSSLHAQVAFAYRSELVVCLRKRRLSLICALAYILGPVALGYLEELESSSPPINGVARCLDSSSNSWCHINDQCMVLNPSTTYRKMVSYPHMSKSHIKIPHIGKWSRTPMFYTTTGFTTNLTG